MQPTAPFCLWNSNYHAVLSDALNTGANIHLECCLALGGTLSRVAVEGQLREVNGREAELAVRTIKVMHLPTKAEDDDCNFYFGIRRQTEGDAAEHLGFYGKAHILATIMGPSGELSSLRLRFSRNFSVRQLRTCQRIPWSDAYSRAAAVQLVVQRPTTCADLRATFGAYHIETPAVTRIIDISEGGTCICMPEEHASPAFATDAIYLFLLIPHLFPPEMPPFVFLAKKAGMGKGTCPQGVAVRLRFQEELDWNARRARLRWINVKGGSLRLRKCLQLYACSLPADAAEHNSAEAGSHSA